jgi:hypothetical protein
MCCVCMYVCMYVQCIIKETLFSGILIKQIYRESPPKYRCFKEFYGFAICLTAQHITKKQNFPECHYRSNISITIIIM